MGGLAKGLPAIASTKAIVSYIGMPEDLSGELEESQHLLSYFDPDLAPHDSFWRMSLNW